MARPSSKRSKLTALISAPAPKASTDPISRGDHSRTRPSTAPMTSDDAASAPQPSASPTGGSHGVGDGVVEGQGGVVAAHRLSDYPRLARDDQGHARLLEVAAQAPDHPHGR